MRTAYRFSGHRKLAKQSVFFDNLQNGMCKTNILMDHSHLETEEPSSCRGGLSSVGNHHIPENSGLKFANDLRMGWTLM